MFSVYKPQFDITDLPDTLCKLLYEFQIRDIPILGSSLDKSLEKHHVNSATEIYPRIQFHISTYLLCFLCRTDEKNYPDGKINRQKIIRMEAAEVCLKLIQ